MKPSRFFLTFGLFIVFGLAVIPSFLMGCAGAKLESGGAYAPLPATNSAGVVTQVEPDIEFYIADAAYKTAWSTVNAAFEFERENRLMLWQLSPGIKHTLDSIRPQAVEADRQYLTARAAYMANPTPTGLTTLQQVLSKVQALASAAQAALPGAKTTPPPSAGLPTATLSGGLVITTIPPQLEK